MTRPLHIAIASGKGGTGKTTIATNLAVTLAEAGVRTTYIDCDVEEPNGHIFLKPTLKRSHEVSIPVPEVDTTKCTLCGACGAACRFSAIVALPQQILTFPKLCHGCGGCALACPEDAIRELPRPIGTVEEGRCQRLRFIHGRLHVGEAMAPPVIRGVLAAAPDDGVVIIDAPPGTSCPVIEAVKNSDVVLLVTEPTPFGLNDLKLAVAMVRALGLPHGVVVNRAGTGDDEVIAYCAKEQVPVLLKLANDRRVAHAYSCGELAVTALPELSSQFLRLSEQLAELAGHPPGARGRASEVRTDPFAEAPIQGRLPVAQQQLSGIAQVPELVVISGKGGTGKTSIVASFAALAEKCGIADCDVDAADLHLVLEPNVLRRWPFSGGHVARIDPDQCSNCGLCNVHCRFSAIRAEETSSGLRFSIDEVSCEGCGVCADLCPDGAVTLVPAVNGEVFVSETRHGPMAHARLGVAQENSGKLVSLVRSEGNVLVQAQGGELLIADGSPGIGCPVISSITGAEMVLVVTEPTLSGLHDLERVAELCRQMRVKATVCINKVDINSEVAAQIEATAESLGVPLLGRIRYDDSVSAAQVQRRSVVEHRDGPAAADMRALWTRVQEIMRRDLPHVETRTA